MRVLITDGEQRSALAVCRSLAASGHAVSIGALGHPCLAGVSQSAKSRFRYDDPAVNQGRFIDDICAECSRFGADLIIPLTDATCFALAAHADRVAKHARVFQPSLKTLHLAADKSKITRLAEKLNVPAPATVEAKSSEDDFQGLAYPIVIKPRRSRVMHEGSLVALGVSYADDEDELRTALRTLPPGAFPVLLQEKISGDGVGYFALAKNGKILAEFYHRRLRELPPTGGVSVLRESIEPDETMQRAGRALLGKLDWTGPAMVEFKRDAGGAAKIMEINGRFWGSLQLAIDAGVDFPSLLVKAAFDEEFEAPTPRYGVRCRYFLGDIESLAVSMIKGGRHLPPQAPSRRAVLKAFVQGRGKPEVFSKNDITPFLLDFGKFIRKFLGLTLFKRKSAPLQGIVHCHTTFSHDGQLSPEALAMHLKINGLSFAAVTEHEDSMTEEKMEVFTAACRRVSKPDFTMIPGIEFATERHTHILGIGVTEFFDEHDPVKIVRGIHAQGGIAILAHPDAGDFEKDEEFLKALDGVEVWNSAHDGPFVPSSKNVEALEIIRKVNPDIMVFGGNDFHRRGHYRKSRIVLKARLHKEIFNSLKNGRFKIKGGVCSLKPGETVGPAKKARIRIIRNVIDLYRPILNRWRSIKKIIRRRGFTSYYPTKLLHTIETGNPGGAERIMLSIMGKLPKTFFPSRSLLLKQSWLKDQIEAMDIPVDIFKLGSTPDFRFFFKTIDLCRRHEISIIHSHEFYLNAIGSIVARLAGCGHVAVIHGNIDFINIRRRRMAMRLALMMGSQLVAVSHAMQRDLIRIMKVPEKRILVIHNGVDILDEPTPVDARKARGVLDAGMGPTIAVIGSIYEIKGHDTLLGAMPSLIEQYPNIRAYIIGRGRGRTLERLQEKARVFGSSVVFKGYIENINEILPGIDVLVVCSLYEGISLALCEAMAMRIPAVATHVGGNPEIINDGENGFLIPPAEPGPLAEKISLLLGDRELRARMGRAARQKVIDNFSVQRMVKDYMIAYDDIIKSRLEGSI